MLAAFWFWQCRKLPDKLSENHRQRLYDDDDKNTHINNKIMRTKSGDDVVMGNAVSIKSNSATKQQK